MNQASTVSMETRLGSVASDRSHQRNQGYTDVWSKWGKRYRTRALVLLVVNILLFACVSMFAFGIRSGVVFAPSMEGYWDQLQRTFSVGSDTGISLGSLLLRPISVQEVPMQIPILGLLMASLISIPILVSILYRFWSSLPFLLIVVFLAVMPWLAVTLLASCVLASIRPFRTSYHFVSALVGLGPTVVYLVLASMGTADAIAGRIDPVDFIKFVAPWVLAIVAAALGFAVVLTIARLVNYRPGAITPLLALMFGLPVVLFECYVGRDELHYRWLESLGEAYFEEVDASEGLREAALRSWECHPLPRPPWDQVLQAAEEKWQMALVADLAPFVSELDQHRSELVYQCDRYHRWYPTSSYVPNVLYLKARALDIRVDATEFRKTKWIRFYDDLPSSASRPVWRMILENTSATPLGLKARLRLAQLDAREGDVQRAVDHLRTLLDQKSVMDLSRPKIGETLERKNVLPKQYPQTFLRISRPQLMLEAHRLHDLCVLNRDPLYGYEPLCGPSRNGAVIWYGLLDLNPHHEMYTQNLQRLLDVYPHCQIEDNIKLEMAKAAPLLSEKISRLQDLLREHSDGDAVPEALYQLAVAQGSIGNTADARRRLAMLLHDFPESPWEREAKTLNSLLVVDQ